MFSFLPILPGDWDQSYHPISQLGKLRHRSATPLLTWHRLSNLFGPGHTRPVPTLCLHLGFLSNSALCVFLSLSLKEITHFMVEAGWRGEWDSSVPPWAPCADPQVGFLQEEGADFLLVSEVDLHCKEHRMDHLMSYENTFAFLLGEAARDNTYLCGPQK